MANHTPSAKPTLQKELILERSFNAPRRLVFKAFTDPVQLAKWWGPTEFTNPVCELDVHPGGSIYVHMKGLDGVVYPMGGEYVEISEPDRLVFITKAFEDGNGDYLLHVHNTILFTEENGRTTIRIKALITKSSPEIEEPASRMGDGWRQSFGKLDGLLLD